MATDNLNITEVAPNQDEKETTMNTAMNALDDATQGELGVTFTANAYTLSALQYTRNFIFACSGQTGSATLTVPLTKRFFGVQNNDTTNNVVVGGATGTTVTVAPSSTVAVYCDGTNCYGFSVAIATGGPVGYGSLPTEVQNSPVTFSFSGKPEAGREVIVPIPQAMTLPANFAGAIAVIVGAAPAADAVFTISVIHSGTTTAIGTIKLAASTGAVTLSTQAAVNLVAGDGLMLTAPNPQDASLTNFGITVMLIKV